MPDLLAPVAAVPAVAEAAAEARSAVDSLLAHRVLRRRSAEVTAESALRGARSSAALEGAHIELERLRGLLMNASPVGDPVVEAAVRLTAGLGELTDVWAQAPRQALARLHVLAAKGIAPDAGLGRPRADGDPSPREVAARVDQLSRVLLEPTSAPAVVVAGVVHGELLALRPFGSVDGLVARAAARLTLISRGLDPKAVSAPEVGHAELHEEYAEVAAAYAEGDVVRWLVHCCQAVALGAREGLAVCAALSRET